jgi:hypothetical protein
MRYGYGYFEEDKLGEVADLRLWRRIIGYTSGPRGSSFLHRHRDQSLAALLSKDWR